MISVLCAIKNRSEHLLQSYKSWLLCEGVDEVVIVDWGSDAPISEKLERHEKLKIVQVNPAHAKYWAFSQAYNTAARFASGDLYVIMNADEILVCPESLFSLEPPSSVFYYEGTSWESKKAHGVYFLYIRADIFWTINGYHEHLIGYGYDDIDFKRRLLASGMIDKESNVKIEHIKHSTNYATWEHHLNYEISWGYPWSKTAKLIELEYTEKDNIIHCDIAIKDRITDKRFLDRKKRGGLLSQAAKEYDRIQ